jgi:demethylmenaquinone methyltransferase/2-methoxy-6-polyprenyl-1,4-benzoquinol methylase
VVSDAMRAYYDRRAREYDDWWLGTGLFAARDRPGWDAEVAQLIEVVEGLPPTRVLDVACGTGFLTQHLRGDVVAIDQSPRMVALTAARVPNADVRRGDAVPLPFPDRAFDRVFTSHFYGHLLPEERRRFVAEARRVGGRLVVVDSALRPDIDAEEWQERRLNDGSRHRVYKRFFEPRELADELAGEPGGGRGEVLHAGRWFVVVEA